MSAINQRKGKIIQVPRELTNLFPKNPTASRWIYNFFLTLSAKLNNANFSLSDVEQRNDNGRVNAKIFEIEKRLDEIEKSNH